MTDHHDVSVIGSGAGRSTLTGEPEGKGFEVYDAEFAAILGDGARLELVVQTDAHEGPVYIRGQDALYFTTLPRLGKISAPGTPRAVIKRLALNGLSFPVHKSRLSALPADVHVPNGMTLGHDGHLVVCEQGTRCEYARISRVDPVTGQVEGLVDGWGGLRLNSPNDVVVRYDGTIWFTDPSYGYLQGFRPEPQLGDYVYRFDPASSRLSVVADCFDKPNGLAFSPDQQTLYITDSGANQEPGSYYAQRPHHILAFDVRDGTHLAGGRLFAVTTPGFPDGLKVDSAGRVYASSPSGVQVFSPAGDLIGRISVPGTVNFTFGGPAGDALFITTDTAIWAAVLNTAAGTSQRHDHTGKVVTAMTAVRMRKALSTAGAEAVMSAAHAEAMRYGYRVVIAIVDPWGYVLQLRRTDGAQAGSGQVAVDKARTAAIFVRPSREIEEQVSAGRLGALALHGAAALTGGIPLTFDGEVIGAIGTSGETPDQDESVSIAGARAQFPVASLPALTSEGARVAAEAAAVVATERGVWPVVAAVDAGGELIHLWRPDRAQVASVQVAADKARTAALYRRPSKVFEDQAARGRPSALHLAAAVPLQGGVPIVYAGHVAGAVGVSGASSADEDNELATLAADAAAARNGDHDPAGAAGVPAHARRR